MPEYRDAVTTRPVDLPRRALAGMIRTVRILFGLSADPAYRRLVAEQLPETARFDPGHDAVMMGYDFHLEGERAKLIEVNTNAGGGLLAYLAHHPSAEMARQKLPERLRRELLHTFSEEMSRFTRGEIVAPRTLAVIDEEPERQFLYGEMTAFAELFRQWGTQAWIADPARLAAGKDGVFLEGRRVDLIYNRHTDFYLETEAMAGVREAYLAGAVCLTPNPFAYGLLADKRRMTLWSDPQILGELGLQKEEIRLLLETVPESRLLASLDREGVWRERQRSVFKPVSRYGSRGVFLGRKISRTRFDELPAEETLVQREIPPSEHDPGTGGPQMKVDFRLYVYRMRVLGVAARLYQGQVTNLRTPGGGFAPVRVV